MLTTCVAMDRRINSNRKCHIASGINSYVFSLNVKILRPEKGRCTMTESQEPILEWPFINKEQSSWLGINLFIELK
jgi:hypothetical protein